MMLGLQAEAGARAIDRAGLAARAVEEVARVELDRGLGGQHLEHPAADRLGYPRRAPQPAVGAFDLEAVVVAAGEPQLLIVVVDPRTDRGSLPEVERRAGD